MGIVEARDNFNLRQYKWDLRFMELASVIGSWSKDRTTKVGCVVVDITKNIIATGYNGLPRGCDDEVEERHDRESGTKYKWAEHGERNAIYAAARHGTSVEDCTVYSTLFPCADCARGIIQSGISCLVTHKPDMDNAKWGADFLVAKEMLAEAGVKVRYV
jgi:dCMP deaminase